MQEQTNLDLFKMLKVKKWLLLMSATFFCVQLSADYNKAVKLAKQKIIERERKEGLSILISEHNKSSSSKTRKLLEEKIDYFSKMFLSTKAQQNYEFSLKIVKADTSQAIDRLNDGLEIEPNNLKLLLLVSRAYLLQAECEESLSKIKMAEELNPFSLELKLVKYQALSCKGDIEKVLAAKPELNESFQDYMPSLVLQSYYIKGMYEQALEWQKQTEYKGQFPEWYYWSYQVYNKLKLNSENYLEKYIELCNKKLSLEKKFPFDIRLCMQMEELAEIQKKKKSKLKKTVEL